MAKNKLSIKTQFISLLSLGLLIFALFSLIRLVGTKTKLYSKAFSNKDFGFSVKLENPANNQNESVKSYIQFDGNLFAPKYGYTIETWFKPTQPEFASKYLFSYQQNDNPLAFIVSSHRNQDGSYDLSFEASVGEDSDGVCTRLSKSDLLENLSENEVINWQHVAITVDERGSWNFFVNGKKIEGKGQIRKLCQTEGNFLIGAGWKDAISPFPVQVDELRISNKVRYLSDFDLKTYPFEKDSNTLALFNFDKDTKSSVNGNFEGSLVGNVTFVKNLYPAE